jgi:hypothetical protein
MKVLTKNDNNICAYIFEDDVEVIIMKNYISAPDLVISDLNDKNSTLHENVTLPDDFAVNKYFYDGTEFTINENYVSPEQLYQEMLERQGIQDSA